MRTWSRQLEELTSLVATLKMEKQELQQRNRILESSLTVNTHHEERLHCNEARGGCLPKERLQVSTATGPAVCLYSTHVLLRRGAIRLHPRRDKYTWCKGCTRAGMTSGRTTSSLPARLQCQLTRCDWHKQCNVRHAASQVVAQCRQKG